MAHAFIDSQQVGRQGIEDCEVMEFWSGEPSRLGYILLGSIPAIIVQARRKSS